MKKYILITLFSLMCFAASAQLTLSQKATLASTQSFRDRIYQALCSKANVYLPQTPANLQWQKQVNYANFFLRGGASSVAMTVTARFWLSNYNGVPVLDGNGQPTDTEILNSAGLDVVYNTLANVLPGDQARPIE